MNKKFIKLYLLMLFVFVNSPNSKAIIFECENGYSYKMKEKEDQTYFFFKKKYTDWQSIKDVIEINNKLEYFLPDSTYLACKDKILNVCKYKSLITYNLATQVANVREVIIADCFIGTMGCNEYKKGLKLNQSYCTKYNK